ncbi:hypothetical protein RUM43_002346 [Polyplax serrata]|uniref:Uncharacterized protein n=1 Tax=Polyplax serrata TaxID=468196 RepID=A0AAN8NZ35_POLSC
MAGKLSKADENSKLSQLGLRLVLSTVTHPVEYAKFLMQIGHEPIPPHPMTNIFGKPVLALPNIFQYIAYIKSVDGTAGCFRGVSAKLCANVVNGAAFETVREGIHFESDFKSFVDEEELDPHVERRQKFVKNFVKDIAGYTVAVITSHPLQVVAARMMAQFVGGETKYSTFVGSIREIYLQNGLGGFYSGLIPRLIGDLLNVCITTSCTYVIHVYFTDDKEIQNYCSAIVGFFATAFTYPFHVVSNCMIVNTSGLKAGSPPQMPIYKSWLHCWKHLESTKQIKRGSSLFWRRYPLM